MRRFLTLAAIAAVTGSCSGGGTEPSGPTAGVAEVRLTSAPAGTGAIMFTVQGGAMSNNAASSGYTAYSQNLSSTSVRVVLVAAGDASNGIVYTFSVPDIAAAGSYSVTPSGGAANASYALVPASSIGMSVTVRASIGF